MQGQRWRGKFVLFEPIFEGSNGIPFSYGTDGWSLFLMQNRCSKASENTLSLSMRYEIFLISFSISRKNPGLVLFLSVELFLSR